MNKNRNLSFDIIKFLAIITVVLIHSIACVYFRIEEYSTESNVILTIDALIRYCVPFFVMVSGALLLNEDKPFSTKDFYLKKVLPTVIIFLIWLVAYSVLYMYINGQSFFDYFIAFKGTDSPHLWYLYMIIGMYFITPILRLFVKRENSKYILLMIVLGLVFGYLLDFLKNFMPDLQEPIDRIDIGFVMGYLPYYLAGWYIVNVGVDKKTKNILMFAGLVSFIVTLVVTLINIDYWNIMCKEKGIFTFFYSVGLFLLIYRPNSEKKNAFFSFFGKRTFGIYISHMLFLELFLNYVVPFEGTLISPYLYILMIYGYTLICSTLFTFIIEKIPVVNRLVLR